jgi:hypothetical protein
MTKPVETFREIQDHIGGCYDGYCVIKKPVGMHTNGGCNCLEDMNFQDRQKVGQLLRTAQKVVDTVIALELENKQLRQALARVLEYHREEAELCDELCNDLGRVHHIGQMNMYLGVLNQNKEKIDEV